MDRETRVSSLFCCCLSSLTYGPWNNAIKGKNQPIECFGLRGKGLRMGATEWSEVRVKVCVWVWGNWRHHHHRVLTLFRVAPGPWTKAHSLRAVMYEITRNLLFTYSWCLTETSQLLWHSPLRPTTILLPEGREMSISNIRVSNAMGGMG